VIELLKWFLLLALPASAMAGAAGDSAFEARYALYSGGARVAEMRRTVEVHGNGTYRYRSETRTTGLFSLFRKDRVVEESLWETSGGQLRPLQYSYEHSGSRKERRVGVQFDWAGERITSTVDGESWQMPASPGVTDKLLYQLAIMSDLLAGQRDGLAYPVADGGKIKTYRFEPLGEETIRTELGEFRTMKLVRQRPDSRRETVLWCAPDLAYLPVRVENTEKDGRKTTAVLESVQGLDQLNRIFD
jgi:hypothetical protein